MTDAVVLVTASWQIQYFWGSTFSSASAPQSLLNVSKPFCRTLGFRSASPVGLCVGVGGSPQWCTVWLTYPFDVGFLCAIQNAVAKPFGHLVFGWAQSWLYPFFDVQWRLALRTEFFFVSLLPAYVDCWIAVVFEHHSARGARTSDAYWAIRTVGLRQVA